MVFLSVEQGLITKMQLRINFAKGCSRNFHEYKHLQVWIAQGKVRLPRGMDEAHVLQAAIHNSVVTVVVVCCFGFFDKSWQTEIQVEFSGKVLIVNLGLSFNRL